MANFNYTIDLYNLYATLLKVVNNYYVVKVSIGRRSQVADGHFGWAQMSNEASHWSFRPRLNGPPWSQMANKS